MRKQSLWTLLLASCVAVSALTIACGDDDSSSSSSSSGSVNDGGNTDANNTDGGNPDGGTCTFAGFVQNLLAQPSNSAPSTDLGDSCTPSTSQADFAPVFAHH